MELELVAYTRFNAAAFRKRYGWTPDPKDLDPDALSEAAGRISYGSWSRPNPATAKNATYMANIQAQGHESIFEHSSATFLVTGASRDMLLQLERHRHTSYSVRSQRYCDESEGRIEAGPVSAEEDQVFLHVEDVARTAYENLVDLYESKGMKRKQARERARLVLPGGWSTEFMVTANLRAWRYVINLRGSEHADAQIREFAVAVAALLNEYAPNVMQDLEFYTHPDAGECVRIKKESK
jgi:thymidylate synthase (FAD)